MSLRNRSRQILFAIVGGAVTCIKKPGFSIVSPRSTHVEPSFVASHLLRKSETGFLGFTLLHDTIVALVVLSLGGCGNSEVGTLYPVSGKVLLNGQPIKVNSGYITLKPDTEKGNSTEFEPAGTIDADGRYEIFTKEYSGAPPGWYKVILTASGVPPKPAAGQSTTRPVAKSLLPSEYGQEATTPLSIEVVESPSEAAYDLNVTD